MRFRAEGVPCEGIDGVVEGGGETDGAEETEPVFGEAEGRVADGAERVVFEVIAAADEVDEVTGERVEEHAIDGEVAALGVGFRGGEDDVVRAAAVEVGAVGAEGGDFEEVAVEVDDDDAEVSADELGAGEEGEDLVRGGAGGDVVVVGLAAEEFVADAAACEVGGVACVGEPPCQVGGGGAEAQRVSCGVHSGNAGTGLESGKAAAWGCGRGQRSRRPNMSSPSEVVSPLTVQRQRATPMLRFTLRISASMKSMSPGTTGRRNLTSLALMK